MIPILAIMFVLCMIWPRATKALVIAPIIGLVLGGLGWSIIAIMNPSFNTFNWFLGCTGVMTLFFEIFLHWDQISGE
jgi:hypothetical protein